MARAENVAPFPRGEPDQDLSGDRVRSYVLLLAGALLLLSALAGWGLWLVRPDLRDPVLAAEFGILAGLAVLSMAAAFWLHRDDVLRADRARALDLTPTVIRGADGVVRYWSRGCEDLFDIAAAQALGRREHDLLGTEFGEPLEAIQWRLRRQGAWQGELRHRLPDGRALRTMSRWAWRERGFGRPPQIVETIADITEARQAQASVRELEAELSHVSRVAGMGEMAAALAHELNQPLTAMGNFLAAADHMLQRPGAHRAKEARNAVQLALRQAERAGDIVRRMREFVRRGDAVVAAEPLPALVEEAAALALLLTRRHPVDVRFELDAAAVMVRANRVQIQQVLLNLMRNAIEALGDRPAPRRLTISACPVGDIVEVRVMDNGPGIDPAVAPSLFDPFVSTKEGGMGVGLFISRRIVEAHGGSIVVEPAAGGGAVFRFTLPIAEEVVADAA